jgi:hypothetical protein
MYFPFLTAQWKAPNGNETLNCAQNQAARDGAVIVQYQHEFTALPTASHLPQSTPAPSPSYLMSTMARYGYTGARAWTFIWSRSSASPCDMRRKFKQPGATFATSAIMPSPNALSRSAKAYLCLHKIDAALTPNTAQASLVCRSILQASWLSKPPKLHLRSMQNR